MDEPTGVTTGVTTGRIDVTVAVACVMSPCVNGLLLDLMSNSSGTTINRTASVQPSTS